MWEVKHPISQRRKSLTASGNHSHKDLNALVGKETSDGTTTIVDASEYSYLITAEPIQGVIAR